MKTIIHVISIAMLLFALCELTACKSDENQLQALQEELNQVKAERDSLKSLSVEQWSGVKAKEIPFCQAERMVNRYINDNGNHYLLGKPDPGQNPVKMRSFHVPKDTLMYFLGSAEGQLDADGIRFHIAQVGTGQNMYHSFVLMGTVKAGVTGENYEDIWNAKLYDFVQPCPTFCDFAKPEGQRFGDVITVSPCPN